MNQSTWREVKCGAAEDEEEDQNSIQMEAPRRQRRHRARSSVRKDGPSEPVQANAKYKAGERRCGASDLARAT